MCMSGVIILVLLVYTINQPTHFTTIKADWTGFQDKHLAAQTYSYTDVHSIVRLPAVQGVKSSYISNYIQTEWAQSLHLKSNFELYIQNRNIQHSLAIAHTGTEAIVCSLCCSISGLEKT